MQKIHSKKDNMGHKILKYIPKTNFQNLKICSENQNQEMYSENQNP